MLFLSHRHSNIQTFIYMYHKKIHELKCVCKYMYTCTYMYGSVKLCICACTYMYK